MILPGMFPAVLGRVPTFAYLGKSLSGADLTTYTFSDFNAGGNGLGAADPDRVIYIAIAAAAAAGRTVSSVTVGGNAATIVSSNPSATNIAVIATIALPTGASGNIVVTFSAGCVTCGIFVWRGVGYAAAATDTVVTNATGAQTLNTAGGGVALGAAYDGGTTPSFSSGLTTDDSGSPEANRNYAGGSVNGTSSGSISVDAAGTTFPALAAASFARV